MTTNPEPDRWQKIKTVFNRNEWLYTLAGFLAGLLALPFIVTIRADFFALLQEFVPEAAGIGFTVFIVDRIYRRREAKRTEEDLKARLIRELGSKVNEIAIRAAEELRAHRWLSDGSLQHKMLDSANLEGASLDHANLRGASLVGANLRKARMFVVMLQEATLAFADLRDAMLFAANLRKANLQNAQLQKADLSTAKLEEATIHYANLEGTTLAGANLYKAVLSNSILRGANLINANLESVYFYGQDWFSYLPFAAEQYFDETTILPDGTHWTPDTDMRRFTDPDHPNFRRFG